MPDELEPLIARWRGGMLSARLKPSTIAELESHLRDDIEHHQTLGTPLQQAFHNAVERLGSPVALHGEFKKLQPDKTMKSRLLELFVIVALVAAQLAILPPIAHQWKSGQSLSTIQSILLVTWAATIALSSAYYLKVRSRKA